jgi:hypothetical protein
LRAQFIGVDALFSIMLPIIGFPNVVWGFTGFFHQVFSRNQFRRFKQYLSGLIMDLEAQSQLNSLLRGEKDEHQSKKSVGA